MTFLDIIITLGGLAAAAAVSLVCGLGLVVWLAGGRRSRRGRARRICPPAWPDREPGSHAGFIVAETSMDLLEIFLSGCLLAATAAIALVGGVGLMVWLAGGRTKPPKKE